MKCPYCGDDFDDGARLVGHVRHKRCPTGILPARYDSFTCPFCGKLVKGTMALRTDRDCYKEHVLKCDAYFASMLTGKPIIEVQQ